MKRSLAVAAVCVIPFAAVQAEPIAYSSPEEAVAGLVGALEARDRDGVMAVFGPENEDLIVTGDRDRDRSDWREFLDAYNTMSRIVEEEGEATLFVGFDQWPLPFPIVLGEDGSWRFDPESGREEILARRIGENELSVIETLRAYVRIQAAYRQIDYDADGVMEFASSVISDQGERNGLYWPAEAGAPESPIGGFMARAADAGYNVDGADNEPQPYLGYYYRILDRQGEGAPGGPAEYMMGGNMVAGHAMLAYPSAYDETGIMTFMVGENGIVYEADLGENTLEEAAAIEAYDPSDGWVIVE